MDSPFLEGFKSLVHVVAGDMGQSWGMAELDGLGGLFQHK